jgi:hypothetical protein
MSIWFHIAPFGLTGLLIYVGVFYAVPRLDKAGVPLIAAFFGTLWLPVVLLLEVLTGRRLLGPIISQPVVKKAARQQAAKSEI